MRGTAQPSFRDWTVLRALGGEIVEVSAFAAGEEVVAEEPVLLSGRFEAGGLLQASILPAQRDAALASPGARQRAAGPSCCFHPGWRAARPAWRRAGDAEPRVEEWPAWDPWPGMVESSRPPSRRIRRADAHRRELAGRVRCLELDDAARRSVERRRASTLDYPRPPRRSASRAP